MRIYARTSRNTGVSVGWVGAVVLALFWPIDLGIRIYAWLIIALFRLMIAFVVYLVRYATHPPPHYRGRHAR